MANLYPHFLFLKPKIHVVKLLKPRIAHRSYGIFMDKPHKMNITLMHMHITYLTTRRIQSDSLWKTFLSNCSYRHFMESNQSLSPFKKKSTPCFQPSA